MKTVLNDKGELFTEDGQFICSLGELLPADDGRHPASYEDDGISDDDVPRSYNPGAGLSETLITKVTEFKLPESKKSVQDALWTLFDGAIHQTMTNTSSPKQQKWASELVHATITASMNERDVAKNMSIADYIQLHLWGRNLIARSTTYEGDRLRDATILGRTLNPGVVDALRYTPDKSKSSGGFFGFLKR